MIDTQFDAIVVGSGISGGWAAKELTEKGLKVLVLERGKDIQHGRDYLGGGLGDDQLFGNNGLDRLVGAAGDDSFDGGPKDDRCATDAEDRAPLVECER